MEKGTKHRLLYLYSYLVKNTDSDHPLSTKQLIQMLKDKHGIHVGRNAIGDDLAVMNLCDMKVFFYDSTQNLYYYDGHPFETAELKLLIDAVASSKFITQRKSEELITKLLNLTNDHYAVMLRRHINVIGRAKSDNEKGYYIVDAINSAIDSNKKVRFYYSEYDVNKERYISNAGMPYTLSPYSLTWDGDYYYVRGYCDERKSMRNFRIDRIDSTPDVLDEVRIMPPDNYDEAKYQKEVFRMFDTDKIEAVEIECDVSVMKSVIDQFGIDVDTRPIDDETFGANISVCTSPTFFRWVFGFNGNIRIVSPEHVKYAYKKMLLDALKCAD